ncbi:unnamed protein product [Durusdinium trenchii]|uniref:Uncharacterized protein n=1 Tax=Durusdinium trenchii TaxID=1381693 RepID=A0ABP0SR10_9DINO
MFAATTSLLNIAALPSGAFLDRYGPRATGMFFCTLIALGCLVFAEGPHHELAYVAGFLLMGVSGPCIFNSTLSFGNLFPKHVGLITASLVGCFDASSAVFATLAHFMTDGMSFSETFHLYMVIPALCALMAARWPTMPVELPEEDVSLDELSGRSLQNICWSVDFLLLSYTASVTMICINFFIATVYPQMHSTSEEEATFLNSEFAALLPAGGIVFIPAIGIVIDQLGPTIGFLILQAQKRGFGTPVGSPAPLDQSPIWPRPSVPLHVPQLVCGLGLACGQRFGFTHFGTVFGLIFTISGICNLAVQPLAALAAQHGFVPVNGFLSLLQLSTVVLPLRILTTRAKAPKKREQPKAVEDALIMRSFSIRSFTL